MKRSKDALALDGPGSKPPDYRGPMPADVAARLESQGVEIRISRETPETPERELSASTVGRES